MDCVDGGMVCGDGVIGSFLNEPITPSPQTIQQKNIPLLG